MRKFSFFNQFCRTVIEFSNDLAKKYETNVYGIYQHYWILGHFFVTQKSELPPPPQSPPAAPWALLS